MSENSNSGTEKPILTPIWESVSQHYDEILTEYLPSTGIDPEKVKRVASIGCGTFFEAGVLTKRFPNAEVIGYEKDPNMVASVSKFPTFPKGVTVKEMDLVADDKDLDGEYDVLVLRNPDIARIQEWKKIISKCINKLTSRGVLITTNYEDFEGQDILPMLQGLEIRVNEHNKNPWADNAIMKTTDNYVIVAQKP